MATPKLLLGTAAHDHPSNLDQAVRTADRRIDAAGIHLEDSDCHRAVPWELHSEQGPSTPSEWLIGLTQDPPAMSWQKIRLQAVAGPGDAAHIMCVRSAAKG